MNYDDLLKDFTKRTKRNLAVIEELHKKGEEVYEVTQLVNSCLGLLVFPKERFIQEIPEPPLEQLEQEGWPIPKLTGNFPQAGNLREIRGLKVWNECPSCNYNYLLIIFKKLLIFINPKSLH